MADLQLELGTLESVVREVLRRLERMAAGEEAASGEGAAPPVPVRSEASRGELVEAAAPTRPAAESSAVPARQALPVESKHAAPSLPPRDPARLRLDDRLIALAAIRERLSGIRIVEVAERAVVTPAARDEMRKRGVRLERAVANSTAFSSGNAASAGLLLAAAVRSFDPRPLLDSLAAELGPAEQMVGECVFEGTSRLVQGVIARGLIGVLLTTRPVTAVCLANRQPSVRAAWAVNLEAVQEAVDGIGANVLIVNPKAHSAFEVRAIVRTFVAGNHRCPEGVRRFLGG